LSLAPPQAPAWRGLARAAILAALLMAPGHAWGQGAPDETDTDDVETAVPGDEGVGDPTGAGDAPGSPAGEPHDGDDDGDASEVDDPREVDDATAAPQPGGAPQPPPAASPPAAEADAPEDERPARDGISAVDAAAIAAIRSKVRQIPEIGECHRDPLRAPGEDLDTRDLTEEELAIQRERVEYLRAVERFVAAAEDYQEEVGIILERSFAARHENIRRRFDREAGEVELDLRQRRMDAIDRFERFVAKYPDNPVHTPDAMFRLAELYYERGATDYADAQDRYNEERRLYERGRIPSEPQPPQRDYSDSVRIYNQLIARFGEIYRYTDAVYYLLGYVQQEQGDDMAARQTWLALVERFPQSEYGAEVSLRVGEIYFDYGEFAEAARIYQRALAYQDSRFYDKALYKLAWTYFQMYDYDRAIRTFKDLIGWYDENAEVGGLTVAALREEAIEYLARSLAEDDWDNDGIEDPDAGVGRALAYLSDGLPFETDIIAKYAESLYDLHDRRKYHEAIEVYRELIRREPRALRAVEFQQQIIRIFDILRDIESATRERQLLADMFSPGSEWERHNRRNLKEVAEATNAVESAMRRRALFLHQRAQELRAEAALDERPELLLEAFDHYRKAAAAYRDYLAKYPSEPASYEMRFFLAETLYYSDQFSPAARAYLEVARDTHHSRFREPSAFAAVRAFEQVLEADVAAGQLPPKADPNRPWDPPPRAEAGDSEVRRVAAEPMPAGVADWFGAVDFYVVRDIRRDGSRRPQVAFAYQAAEMSMRYSDYEEARRRFRQVIACFPEDPLAADALANILNTYRDENDFPSLERWANIAEGLELGDPELTAQIRERIKVFKLGAQFQRAEVLLEEDRFVEAAREFERIADENPGIAFLDKAYFNAAKAYNEAKYYESASRIFERLVNEPRFKDSEFYNDSLFELAENYKLFFNFESAVSTFLRFFSRTEGTDEANRPYALYTAALLKEYSGEQARAARTYERYAEVFQDRADSANALFRAAEIYGELQQRNDQRRILQLFVRRFNDTEGMGVRVLQATLRLGDLALEDRRTRDALNHYREVLREYQARGFEQGTPAAAIAAEARFKIVERTFEAYTSIRLTENMTGPRMQQEFARKLKMLQELELAYGEILPYGSLDWNIAAYYRLGDIYRDFAQTLYQAPTPRGLSDDELDIYYTQVEDEGLKLENVAIERFERTVVEAGRLRVTNEWARRALVAINQYKPADFPLYRETKREPTFTPRFRIERRMPGEEGP